MIKELINRGFKDQHRHIRLSGRDLFTSDDVNGVGKSAVLEAFKLALLGEIPGRAKTVDDILQFTSGEDMKVGVVADTGEGPVVIERGFFGQSASGEKRPVWINRMARKYEEGSLWIRETVGAVSISFDPFEFLNLPDSRKRQWIIDHSPESRFLSRQGLYLMLLARVVEHHLGRGIVCSVMEAEELNSIEEVLSPGRDFDFQPLARRLEEVFQNQEPAYANRVREILETAFELWSPSRSAEENVSALLGHLKSESLRLKKWVREQTVSVPGRDSSEKEMPEQAVTECREAISELTGRIEELGRRLEGGRMRVEADRKRKARIRFLEENIARSAEVVNGKMVEALRNMRNRLQKQQVDLKALEETRTRLHDERDRRALELGEWESIVDRVSRDLKLKQEKQDALSDRHFICPVAKEIRCDTNMEPYRQGLTREIESLIQEQTETERKCDRARKELSGLKQQIETVEAEWRKGTRSNEKTQREIDLLQEQIQAEEKEVAKARGRLKAYQEELESQTREPSSIAGEKEEPETLEKEKSDLNARKQEKEKTLAELLRRKGKADALAELNEKKRQWQNDLHVVQQIYDLLGPDGIQGEMASRIAGALESEVNDILQLIDSRYRFHLNLQGPRVEMGWNRAGRVIPFKTINSAHFVIFIVPFLAALMRRMAGIREKSGLPTLKALCIEAESLTPDNLSALLRGLSVMKEKGFLDNVLVAHYHSVHDPETLSGFQEHILEETPVVVTEGCS